MQIARTREYNAYSSVNCARLSARVRTAPHRVALCESWNRPLDQVNGRTLRIRIGDAVVYIRHRHFNYYTAQNLLTVNAVVSFWAV